MKKFMMVVAFIALAKISIQAQTVLLDENFDNWVNGLPSGWVKSNTITDVQNDANRVKITVPNNHPSVITGLENRSVQFKKGKKYKVTVKVDAISAKEAFRLTIEGWNKGCKDLVLATGINEFTVDLTFDASLFYINDVIHEPYGGAYPHSITIDSIKIEEL